MKLEKAIWKLENYPIGASPDNDQDFNAAILLGIEALKYVLYRDSCPGLNTRLLLPGETEE